MHIISWPLLLSILSGVAFVVLGLAYKLADQGRCRAVPFATAFLLIAAGVSAAGCLLFRNNTWHSPVLWGMGLGMGIILFLGIALVALTNRLGPASVTWTVLNLGLLLPVLLAPVLFREPLLWVDAILITLFVLMLLAFARGMGAAGEIIPGRAPLFWILVFLLFLNNGVFLTVQKLKFQWFHDANSTALPLLLYTSGALAGLLTYHLRGGRRPFTREEWRAGALAGAASSLGILCFLGSVSLPAMVTFPISQGIALLGGVVATKLVFGERFNLFKTLGLALGVAVLLACVFREPIAAIWHPLGTVATTHEYTTSQKQVE